MVSFLFPTLLLAATASAQVTTSFVKQLFPLDTNNIGYFGSVVAVNDSQTIVVLHYDNGTDTSALSIAGSDAQTMTIGPNLWGQQDDRNYAGPGDSSVASDANAFKLYCERGDDAAADWTCTGSYGPSIAANIQCNTGAEFSEASTTIWYNTHSYTARLNYSAGTETVTQTLVYEPDNTSTPAWCSNDPEDYPTEGSSTVLQSAATNFAAFQVVLTAGLEKLSATQAATPTEESAMPTGSGNATPTAVVPEFTGAAASLAGQQMLVGMGAAVAAFFLLE